jgi:hypothetical protein
MFRLQKTGGGEGGNEERKMSKEREERQMTKE